MDTSALAGTLIGMQSAATAQQMSLLAVKNANAMAQVAVNLLGQAAEAGKALVGSGVGGNLDRSAWMPFEVAKNGMRMYLPSWQLEPGSAMKAANRAASNSYFANASSLGGNFLGAVSDQTAGMMEITTKIVTKRLQDGFQAKLAQAKAGFDVTI